MASVRNPREIPRALSELRRIAGLTWDDLGQLFGASRRDMDFWASGQPLDPVDRQHVFEILDIARWADRGDTGLNRAALFTMSEGKTSFDLLAEKRFDEARARLGRGPGRRRAEFGGLDLQARIERKPLPPVVLMNALNDPIHQDPEAVTPRGSREPVT